MEKIPVFEMLIDENPESDLQVDFIALVDRPAIKKDFLAFAEQEFINPKPGEKKDEYIPRCIAYKVNEGIDQSQAAAVCYSIWDQHFAAIKISFDYDGTLSTSRGKDLAKKKIAEGSDVYIISARNNKDGMLGTANELGIPESRVYATGSNDNKVAKIKELGITKHYDNNSDVVAEIPNAVKFQIQDAEKRIISGPLMVADTLIDRYDEENGAYRVFFSKDTIRKIAIKMAQKGFQNNVNLMHDGDMKLEGLTLFEVFQSDKERGISPMKGFEDLPDGSLFGSMYVGNDGAWNLIQTDMVKGFSVEGNFGMKQVDKYSVIFSEIVDILSSTKF